MRWCPSRILSPAGSPWLSPDVNQNGSPSVSRRKKWKGNDPKARAAQATEARTAMLAKLGHPLPEKNTDSPPAFWAPMFSPAALTLSWPSSGPVTEPQPEPEPNGFYAEPMVGWREWAVYIAPDGTPSLKSLYGDSPGSGILWPHRERLAAVCDSYHSAWPLTTRHDAPAPVWNCTCGIYGRSKEEPREGAYPVWGEVFLWGKVIRHSAGYRAQFAYPKRLYVDAPTASLLYPDLLAAQLSEAYGVPCEVRERPQSLGDPGSWMPVLAGSLQIPAGSPVMISGWIARGRWTPRGKITVTLGADPAPDNPAVTEFSATGYARQSVSWTTTQFGVHGHPKLAGPVGLLP